MSSPDCAKLTGKRRYQVVGSSHFVKACPTCGRTLQIQVRYMGREVSCGHCQGRFLAFHNDLAHETLADLHQPVNVMQRADELLNSIDDSI